MHKKLIKTGNSLAVVLDRAMLDQIGIDQNTPLEVSTDGRVIVLSPVRDRKRAAKVKAIVEDLDRRYAGVFKRLAE
jgi:antitoxin component of MazEF toxin-antitoxin module